MQRLLHQYHNHLLIQTPLLRSSSNYNRSLFGLTDWIPTTSIVYTNNHHHIHTMPPKSALLTAGDPLPRLKPTYTRDPLTTAQRLANVEVARAKALKNVPRSPPPDAKPKKKSMAPPEETERLRALKAKNKARVGKSTKPRKPLTTREKLAASDKKAKSKNANGLKKRQAEADREKEKVLEGRVDKGKRAGKTRTVKRPGMMSILREHSPTAVRFAGKKDGLTVICRPTQRTEMHARELRERAMKMPEVKALWGSAEVQVFARKTRYSTAAKVLEDCRAKAKEHNETAINVLSKLEKLVDFRVLPYPGVIELDAVDIKGEHAVFRFLDLPERVRKRVYKFAVVEQRFFIPPDHEQPDLAMVNKLIRMEILPVYYSSNTFKVDLTPPPPLIIKPGHSATALGRLGDLAEGTKKLSGMQTFERRAEAIESGGWLKHIHKWVLDYAPPRISKLDSHGDYEEEDASFMLAIEFKPSGGSANVEIHHEASCILPTLTGYGRCAVQLTPKWVNELVIEACEKLMKHKEFRAAVLVELVRAVQDRVRELVGKRCEVESV
ncbi:hypothetical protein BAUCODRAFT_403072 [Baudoinia panamericana UAMH 10762]|uniref:Uncharacterized protein n=1 Tax=Baudoinia panamericana (strain UAMH 10762) TaxID=717646 RepID=M2MM48_BAUPA|nr:uncharacterized protein BAUCODRAFT_403072 [Baudoinia panamericana UAMH 10762]EMC97756.1 hypothetical protein BAUCODRAFT_403072 [Baudoinia panamericana UAMH 10762]